MGLYRLRYGSAALGSMVTHSTAGAAYHHTCVNSRSASGRVVAEPS